MRIRCTLCRSTCSHFGRVFARKTEFGSVSLVLTTLPRCIGVCLGTHAARCCSRLPGCFLWTARAQPPLTSWRTASPSWQSSGVIGGLVVWRTPCRALPSALQCIPLHFAVALFRPLCSAFRRASFAALVQPRLLVAFSHHSQRDSERL